MRAAVIESYGGPEQLHVQEVDDPKVGPDFVLVRLHAAALNPVDTKIRAGRLDGAFPAVWPMVLGWDACGEVERVGPAARHWTPGDRVVAYARKHYLGGGCYGDLVALPAQFLAPAPRGVDPAHAAGLPLAGLTAYQALFEGLRIERGQTLLVHAAGGGVGTFAVQLAKRAGATVVGTGSRASFDRLSALGVDHCVDYHDGPVSRQVRAALPGGVDAVLDLVGGDALRDSPQALADGGRLVSIVEAPTVLELGGAYVFVRPDAEQLASLSAMVDDGTLRIDVAETYPLDQVADAHRRLEEGHVHGKLVLDLTR